MLSSHTSVILQGKPTRPAEAPRLQLSSGFVWDVGLDSLTPALPPRGDSSDSEEDDEPQQATVAYFAGLCPLAGTPGCQSPLLCPGLSVLLTEQGSLRPVSNPGAHGPPCQLWLPAQTALVAWGAGYSRVFVPSVAEEEQEGKAAGEAEGRERTVPH